MDGERFDDLSRRLARPHTRREVLGILSAAVAGIVVGKPAAAAPKKDKPSKCYGGGSHCTNGKQCCSGICTNRQCEPEIVLACEPYSTQSCYSGPAGTEGVGICSAGTQTCLPDGSGYGACEGEVLPTTETCNGSDENCNGVSDDGAYCEQIYFNAGTECRGGECVLGLCNPDWGNCDGNPLNGCETHLKTSSSHCGACGRACPTGTICDNYRCCTVSGPPITGTDCCLRADSQGICQSWM